MSKITNKTTITYDEARRWLDDKCKDLEIDSWEQLEKYAQDRLNAAKSIVYFLTNYNLTDNQLQVMDELGDLIQNDIVPDKEKSNAKVLKLVEVK